MVAQFVLSHGEDPVRELARLGWGRPTLLDATREADGSLRLTFAVSPCSPWSPVEQEVPTDADLVLEPGERAEPYQRTAAYGVVTSERGLLLTELSELTSAPGRWTLPGGGLDDGESPVSALHREVWEESGQTIEQVRLLEAHTSHWVGRAPSGRLEDFHAVRIVYAAWCPDPTDPVVHDVGGSTAAVRWVPLDQVRTYHLGRSFAPHLQRWLTPPA
jgi:8-oxo-dGTP pyrophosphatase MutT (NUDIX family)